MGKAMKMFKAYYPLFAILLMASIIYSPVLGNDFLYYWDDQWMVTNSYTMGGWAWENLWHIFTDFYNGQYAPLAGLEYLSLYAISGYDPFVFHLMSLLWHMGCICLVWNVVGSLLKLHGGMSEMEILYVTSITTLLFAVHPVNVESVAWISAVKVLIYGFFYLLGLVFYIRYIQTFKFGCYLAVSFCFLFSFWGKEQAVTFPFALLIVDWFANRGLKGRNVWYEKSLFFILGLFFGVITVLSQGNGISSTVYPFSQRIVFACYALLEYVTKSLFPVQLNYLYPFPIQPGEALPLWLFAYPIIFCCLLAWGMTLRNNKYIVLGLLLFLVNLLFSVHLIPLSRHAIVADRYLYLSYIGIAFLIAYALLLLNRHIVAFRYASVMFVLYVVYLSGYTYLYSQKWRNTSEVKRYLRELVDERIENEKAQSAQTNNTINL